LTPKLKEKKPISVSGSGKKKKKTPLSFLLKNMMFWNLQTSKMAS
jgi:hypothetical protein